MFIQQMHCKRSSSNYPYYLTYELCWRLYGGSPIRRVLTRDNATRNTKGEICSSNEYGFWNQRTRNKILSAETDIQNLADMKKTINNKFWHYQCVVQSNTRYLCYQNSSSYICAEEQRTSDCCSLWVLLWRWWWLCGREGLWGRWRCRGGS